MPTYAVLGATGQTGKSLIQVLLQSKENHIKAYCRNKAKLAKSNPEIVASSQVDVFEGDINSISLLASCISNCRAVFLVISTNDNVPGLRVGQDVAVNIIRALEELKLRPLSASDVRPRPPKIVLLSSASIDDHLSRDTPYFWRQLLLCAVSNVYSDLQKTETILRAEQDWLTTIFIKPGALSSDIQRGHGLSFDYKSSPISYLDLAAAMIESADDPDQRYDMQNVSVVNVNGSPSWPTGIRQLLLLGLLRHFFPFLHSYLPSAAPS